MSSITLTLTGTSSTLSAHFCPEIDLDDQNSYSCCLLDFYTFNSIPNVHERNNKIYYSKDKGNTLEYIEVPVGSYEIEELVSFLNVQFKKRSISTEISTDKNTMKCWIKTEVYIDFVEKGSLRDILGFNPWLLGVGQYVSDHVINIQRVNNLRIDCDLITGSYHNGQGTHTIYEFDPSYCKPGYKIIEQPKHLIYLPVSRRRISTINISILDENGGLVDFRGETITVRVHIKRET